MVIVSALLLFSLVNEARAFRPPSLIVVVITPSVISSIEANSADVMVLLGVKATSVATEVPDELTAVVIAACVPVIVPTAVAVMATEVVPSNVVSAAAATLASVTVIGEPTAGSATMALEVQLPGGGGFKIATVKALDENGKPYKYTQPDITHIPSLEDEKTGRFLGMINLGEIRPYLFNPVIYDAVILEQIMDHQPDVVHIDDDLYDVLKRMDEKRLFTMPVIYNNRFVGMISKATLLDRYRQELRVQTSH